MREKSGILMKWAFWRDFRHTGAAQLIGPADSEPNVVMASQLSCWESCSPATCSCWRSRGWEWPPLASPPDPRKQKNPTEGTGTVHFVGKGPCFQSSGRVVRGKRVWELGTSEVSWVSAHAKIQHDSSPQQIVKPDENHGVRSVLLG